MKTIDFKKLNDLCKNKIMIDESSSANYCFNKNADTFARSVMTNDGTLKTRSHNIQLKDKNLWYENNNSASWTFEFDTIEQAEEWWKNNIKTAIIHKQSK